MRKSLIELHEDEGGATALEYALMAAAIAGVLIVVAYFLGGKINNSLSKTASHF